MKAIEIFTIVGITATLLLGAYNLLINIRSQRKFQRELIFSKQFDFYMELQKLLAEYEDAISDMNMSYINNDELNEKIFSLSNKIDLHITKNEIIIPEILYSELSKYSEYCHTLSTLAYKDSTKINETIKSRILDKNIDLVDNIRELIGIEHLSNENRKLVRGTIEK